MSEKLHDKNAIKTGLVLEGGAMRGMFTAGVLDVLMEDGITADGVIGVSAGAVFGCNFKSRQIGRTIRYNKKFCRDKRYVSLRSWLFTGDLYGVDFAYRLLPEELDPFDNETFESSPMEFYVTCTDVLTGKAVYHKCETSRGMDLLYMRASASLPMAARLVEIDGRLYSDGGMADSVPLKHFQSLGYNRNLVILTQPADFVKQKNKMLPLMRILFKKYPNMVHTLETRHLRYNESTAYIREQEKLGMALVIQPERPLNIGPVEHNPEELERVYQHGRSVAKGRLSDIKTYLQK